MTDPVRKIAEDTFSFAYKTCKEIGHPIGETDNIFVTILLGKLTELVVNECISVLKENQVDASYTLRQHFNLKNN